MRIRLRCRRRTLPWRKMHSKWLEIARLLQPLKRNWRSGVDYRLNWDRQMSWNIFEFSCRPSIDPVIAFNQLYNIQRHRLKASRRKIKTCFAILFDLVSM